MSLFEEDEIKDIQKKEVKVKSDKSRFEPLDYIKDIREFLKVHPQENLPPSMGRFSQETLQKLPGMEWLGDVRCDLYKPFFTDKAKQWDQLQELKKRLLDKAIVLKEGFCTQFPKGYSEKVLSLDTETTGLDSRVLFNKKGELEPQVDLVGLCLAVSDVEGFYLPIKHTEEDGVLNWDIEVIIKFCDDLHQSFAIVYHNAQYDREILALNGMVEFRPWPYFFDTQLLDFFLDCVTENTEVTLEFEGTPEQIGSLMCKLKNN